MLYKLGLDVTRESIDTAESDDAGAESIKRGRFAFNTKLGDFLRNLASSGKSKVLISSRLFPADLEGMTEQQIPGALSKKLRVPLLDTRPRRCGLSLELRDLLTRSDRCSDRSKANRC